MCLEAIDIKFAGEDTEVEAYKVFKKLGYEMLTSPYMGTGYLFDEWHRAEEHREACEAAHHDTREPYTTGFHSWINKRDGLKFYERLAFDCRVHDIVLYKVKLRKLNVAGPQCASWAIWPDYPPCVVAQEMYIPHNGKLSG